MTINHTALADSHYQSYNDRDRAVRPVTAADMTDYRDRLEAFVASDAGQAIRRRGIEVDVDTMMTNPSPRSVTLPAFFRWLRDTNQPPFAAETTTATVSPQGDGIDWAALAVEVYPARAVRQTITPELLAPYTEAIWAWITQVGSTEAALHSERGSLATGSSGGYDSIAGMLENPPSYSQSLPRFAQWVVANPTHPALPANRAVVTAPAPATPRAAFTSLDQALAAYDRWAADPDERLPEELSDISGSMYNRRGIRAGTRGGGWAGQFHAEIRVAWDQDDFTVGSNYARGFWRDVRDLGYGTPRWTQPTAVTTAVPQWLRGMVEWRGGRPSNERLSPDIDHAVLRRVIEAYITATGALRSGYTVDEVMRDPYYHDTTLPAVARWALDHLALAGFEQAAPATPRLPLFTVEMANAYHTAQLNPYREDLAEWAPASTHPTWGSEHDLNYVLVHPSEFRYWLVEFARAIEAGTYVMISHRTPRGPVVLTADMPIGPDHPGWNDWWLRLYRLAQTNNYPSYYERLARSLGGPLRPDRAPVTPPPAPAARRRTVRLTIDVPVETAAGTVDFALQQEALRLAQSGTTTFSVHGSALI